MMVRVYTIYYYICYYSYWRPSRMSTSWDSDLLHDVSCTKKIASKTPRDTFNRCRLSVIFISISFVFRVVFLVYISVLFWYRCLYYRDSKWKSAYRRGISLYLEAKSIYNPYCVFWFCLLSSPYCYALTSYNYAWSYLWVSKSCICKYADFAVRSWNISSSYGYDYTTRIVRCSSTRSKRVRKLRII